MSDNGTRIVFNIEGIDEERVIVDSSLDSSGYLFEELFSSIDEDLIEMFLLTHRV